MFSSSLAAVSTSVPAAPAAAVQPQQQQPAQAALLTNIAALGSVRHVRWRAFRLPAAEELTAALGLTQRPSQSVQQAMAESWLLLQQARSRPQSLLLYHLELDDAQPGRFSSLPALLLIIAVAFTGREEEEDDGLAEYERRLSQWLADGDRLLLPLSSSSRLQSAAFFPSLLQLLSDALSSHLLRGWAAVCRRCPCSPPALDFLFLRSTLCARLLPASSHSAEDGGREGERGLQRAQSSIASLLAPFPEQQQEAPPPPAASAPSSSPPPLPPAAALNGGAEEATDLGSAPPSKRQKLMLASTLSSSPSQLSPPTAARPPALQLPSYLQRFLSRSQRSDGTAADWQRPLDRPAQAEAAVDCDAVAAVRLAPNLLADLALSFNSFPSLSPLSAATQRSLAISDSAAQQTGGHRADAAFTLHRAWGSSLNGQQQKQQQPQQHWLPSSPAALAHASPPSSQRSPPSASPSDSPAPGLLAATPSPALLASVAHTGTSLSAASSPVTPFSPWLDGSEPSGSSEEERGESAADLRRLLRQQALSPLSAELLQPLPPAAAAPQSAVAPSSSSSTSPQAPWLAAQSWLDSCALLSRAFAAPDCAPLLAHTAPLASLSPGSTSLPLSVAAPPRVVAGFESETREFPLAAVALWEKAGLRPAGTQKELAFVVVPPPDWPNRSLQDESGTEAGGSRKSTLAGSLAASVDGWMEGLSAVYESCGLGRHRALQAGRRSCLLRLPNPLELNGSSRQQEPQQQAADTPTLTPPPTPPASAATASSSSPAVTSPILLAASSSSRSTSTTGTASADAAAGAGPEASRLWSLLSRPASDGRRRFYQAIVSALLLELETLTAAAEAAAASSSSPPPPELDRLDGLVLYVLTSPSHPHSLQQLSLSLSCLRYDAKRDSASPQAGLLSQLEHCDVVLRFLPASLLLPGAAHDCELWRRTALSLYRSVCRCSTRLDSEVEVDGELTEVELPPHVEQVVEPPFHLAAAADAPQLRSAAGRDDAAELQLHCLWRLSPAGRLLACACDERGQVLVPWLASECGASAGVLSRCWEECVEAALTLLSRHRRVQRVTLVLTHWTGDEGAAAGEEQQTVGLLWQQLLSARGFELPAAGEPMLRADQQASRVKSVVVCGLSSSGRTSLLGLQSRSASALLVEGPPAAAMSSLLLPGPLCLLPPLSSGPASCAPAPLSSLLLFPPPRAPAAAVSPSSFLPSASGLTPHPPSVPPEAQRVVSLHLSLQAVGLRPDGKDGAADSGGGRPDLKDEGERLLGLLTRAALTLHALSAASLPLPLLREEETEHEPADDESGASDTRASLAAHLPLPLLVLHRMRTLCRAARM